MAYYGTEEYEKAEQCRNRAEDLESVIEKAQKDMEYEVEDGHLFI